MDNVVDELMKIAKEREEFERAIKPKNNVDKDGLSTNHYGVGGLDPYTVYHKTNMKENEIGGVIFHILKTAMRFGRKNDKKRELQSIIASAKRGLELLEEDEKLI